MVTLSIQPLAIVILQVYIKPFTMTGKTCFHNIYQSISLNDSKSNVGGVQAYTVHTQTYNQCSK